MEKLCVLCNQLFQLTASCPNCGNDLSDQGLIQDYYDSYSPYEDQTVFEDGYRGYTEECCVHLLACPCCRFREFRALKRLPLQNYSNEMPELTNIKSLDNSVHRP
ncbi:conserved hypothetical protein [Desulforamulus hydrothermalis Lam5 = DSM 18033]|uniref:Uncharacterized protein n=1 Tax=Desulforamulus hydrothermalis Lam5 = DSM 18033 TaxID=1121428 RepID=K8E692_9FIRM|nr:conserved hypothetical protein [Desulforamulus hydrothermalis Lam5 = DSM 18033]